MGLNLLSGTCLYYVLRGGDVVTECLFTLADIYADLWTTNAAGTCNAAVGTYTMVPAGENISHLLTRVLGPSFAAAPLFTSLPSYATANIRGSITINEKTGLFMAFVNIFDSFTGIRVGE